jgi:predicted HicB family RNase H-like nuclease
MSEKNSLTQKDKNTILVINRLINRIKNNPNQSITDFTKEHDDVDYYVSIIIQLNNCNIIKNIGGSKTKPYYITNHDVINVDDYIKLRDKVRKTHNENYGERIRKSWGGKYDIYLQGAYEKMDNVFTSQEFTKQCRRVSDSNHFNRLLGHGELVPDFLKDKTTKLSKFTYEKKTKYLDIKDLNNQKQETKEEKKKTVRVEPRIHPVVEKKQKSIVVLWGLINIKF